MKLSEIIGTSVIGGFGSEDNFGELQIRGKDGKIFNLTAKNNSIIVTPQRVFRG
jgi:hypothetical protein